MSTTEILVQDQKWITTPFHCIVGNLKVELLKNLSLYIKKWEQNYGPYVQKNRVTMDVYPTLIKERMKQLRGQSDNKLLFFTNNPLVANEMQYEECSLLTVENNSIVLTNFTQLHDAKLAREAFYPGEFWLNYCDGKSERSLRFGERDKK